MGPARLVTVSDAKKLRCIGILLFADVEELDAIGPWEVLSYWCRNYPEDDWTVTTLSPSGGLAGCAKGLTVQAQHAFADCPALDVLIHPGGQGTRPQLTNPTHLDWVRRQRQQVPLMASVCT